MKNKVKVEHQAQHTSKKMYYEVASGCPHCGERRRINIIKIRSDHEECRTCGKSFVKAERLDKRLKNETDW